MAASMAPREFVFTNANAKLLEEKSCLKVIEREIPVGLPPRYLGKVNEFIKLVLTAKLGRYDERLQCVPVSIRKVKRYGTTGQIYGEDPNTYFKILVEFVIFQPSAGSQVTGQVNRLSNSHLGLLVHEWFNASISKNYNDDLHSQVGAGDTVLVEIIKTNVARRMISLECKLISILKKSEADMSAMVDNSVLEEVEGGEDSESKVEVVEVKKGKKRSRNETIGSDSGIDHDKLDQSFSVTNSKSDNKQPASKKHKKSEEDEELSSLIDDSASDEDTEPVVSPKKTSPRKSPEKAASVVNGRSPTKDSLQRELVFSELDDTIVEDEPTENVSGAGSLTSPGSGTRKSKKSKTGAVIPEITSSQSTVGIGTSANETDNASEVTLSPSKKSKKKKKSKRDDVESQETRENSVSDHQRPEENTQLEEFKTPSSKKSKKKKRDKDNESSLLDDSLIEDSRSVSAVEEGLHDSAMACSTGKKSKKKRKDKDLDVSSILESSTLDISNCNDSDGGSAKKKKKKKKHKSASLDTD